jgi:PAS domain S-box-containing protein
VSTRPSGVVRSASIGSRPAAGTVARYVYLGTVIAAGGAVLSASALQVTRDFPGPLWLLLVAMTCVTGWSAARMPGFPISLSMSDAFTIAAALLFGPGAGALTVACDGLIGSGGLNRARRTWPRVLFNVTAPALSLWLAAHLFFRMSGSRPLADSTGSFDAVVVPLTLFAVVYFLLNTGLVAGAIAIGRDASLPGVWRRHFLPLWWTHAAGTSMATLVLLAMTAGLARLQTILVVLPLLTALVIGAGLGVIRLRRRSAEFAELRSYAAALRSTGDAVILADGDGRVTFLNPAAEQLTGWAQAEARGAPATAVLRSVRGEDAGPADHADSLVRRDGTTCPVEETRAEIRDEEGNVTGFIRTFRDVTERRALESERGALLLREQDARAAAEAANRTKDEFLATLSHELRTPATAIMGWTRLLQGGRLDDAGAQRALAALDRSARAQTAVLNDLLDVSRIVRGALRLNVRRASVSEVIRDAVDTVEPAVSAKGIDLRLECEPDLPVIDADPDRLRQVFWNLLSNAVKFTPEDGAITVVTRREHDMIRTTIADTGCGIAADFLPHMFDRFRQGDASNTRSYAGLGLGLAIVQHLVEAHGGTVTGTSDGRDCGAQFTVSLPAVSRRRGSDAQDAAAADVANPRPTDHVPMHHDADYFEHLIMQAVTTEAVNDTWWHGVLRIDRYTFCPITTTGGKDAIEQESENRRRVLAMVFARTLQAYGVRPEIPVRWKDRRDPQTQSPRRGGRRAMDTPTQRSGYGGTQLSNL